MMMTMKTTKRFFIALPDKGNSRTDFRKMTEKENYLKTINQLGSLVVTLLVLQVLVDPIPIFCALVDRLEVGLELGIVAVDGTFPS